MAPLPRLAGCLLLAALLAAAEGLVDLRPARAASSVPPEPGALRLDGPTADAGVADVDGDGVREVVRIVPWTNDPNLLAVEVIREVGGRWESAGEALLERPNPEGSDVGALGPASVDDAVRVVAWHDHGRERLFVLVNAAPSIIRNAPCCLTGWEVAGLGRGRPILHQVFTTSRGGDAALSLDMDGDGTDEIAVHQPAGPDTPASLAVLRWNGTSFRELTLSPLLAGDPTRMSVLGDSDGLPGEEVGFVGSFSATSTVPAYGLTRVSMRGGKLHDETNELPADGRPLAVSTGAGVANPLIVVGDLDTPLVAYRWPADGSLQRVEASARTGRPVAVLGSGASARLVVDRGLPAGVDLLGPDLGDGNAESGMATAAARAFRGSSWPPYVGPWPDEPSAGAAGFVADGVLIHASPGLPPDTVPMAVLPGVVPLGTVGAGGAVATLQTLDDPTQRAERPGGALLRNQHYIVAIAPVAEVLAPEADAGLFHPSSASALVDRRDPRGTTVFVGPDGIGASVEAPSGTVAEARAGDERTVDLFTGVDPGGTATQTFPFRLPMSLSTTKNGNQAFDAALYLATPAGHGYVATWKVTALRESPPLQATGPFLSLGPLAEITGTTSAAATVTVDGRRATMEPDGRFRVGVPAGLLPRDVRVEAADPFGHASVIVVSVVAPLDYRLLPWIPIVAVLTLILGAVLFLRGPRLTARKGAASADDVPFEELEPED